MNQLEIQYFWPLTEQWNLDLDFTPCQDYEKKLLEERCKSSITLSSGTGLTFNAGASTWTTVSMDPTYQNFTISPSGAVGFWQVTPNMSVGCKSKPRLLHRIFTKFILGWEWKDK